MKGAPSVPSNGGMVELCDDGTQPHCRIDRVALGLEVFQGNPNTSCSACHSTTESGTGLPGPALDGLLSAQAIEYRDRMPRLT